MALEEVKDAIVDKAKAQARDIVNEAKDRRRKILGEAEEEAHRVEEERLDAMGRELKARFERERSSLRFGESRDSLIVEKETLDMLKGRFTAALFDLSPKEHEALLQALLGEARGAMAEGTVSVCARDVPVAKKVLKGMMGYSLGPEVECLGGAVVTAPDGERSLDMRYETFLEDVWKERLHHISGRLFGGPEVHGPPGDEAAPAGAGTGPVKVGSDGGDDKAEEDWDETDGEWVEDDGEDEGEEEEEEEGAGEDDGEEEVSSGMVSWE